MTGTAPDGTAVRLGPRQHDDRDLGAVGPRAGQDGRHPGRRRTADGRVDAGDSIAYRFLLTNTGDATLTNLAVTDAEGRHRRLPGDLARPGREHAPAPPAYTITQADVDSGAVVNTASASALAAGRPAGAAAPDSTTTTTSRASTLRSTRPPAAPTDVNADGRVDAGDTVAYRFAVTTRARSP